MTQLPIFAEEPSQQRNQPVPGTLVLSRDRLPDISQPWVAPFHVGILEEPEDDPAKWNGENSERYYCEKYGKAKIRYSFGVLYDRIDALIPITVEQAALSHREKIAQFLGDEALSNYDRTTLPRATSR